MSYETQLLLALILALALVTDAVSPPCLKTSHLTPHHHSLPPSLTPNAVIGCANFYSNPKLPAIRMPNDTNWVKYGTLDPRTMNFTDRLGMQYKVRPDAVPVLTPEERNAVYYTIFKARFGPLGRVRRLEAAVFVDSGAMLHPFEGLMFAGRSTAIRPPAGVPKSEWILFEFGKNVENVEFMNETMAVLKGKMVNRNRKVIWNGSCRPAVVSNETEKAFYDTVFGTENVVKMSWFPQVVSCSPLASSHRN
jgi:hypothetical protein